MQRTVDLGRKGQSLSCDYHPIYTYATWAARQHPVRSLKVEGRDGGLGRLNLQIPEISYAATLGGEELCGPLKLPPLGVATELELERTLGRLPVNLEMVLDHEVVARIPITILPSWQWGHSRDARILAAAYVLPGDEVVSRTLTAMSAPSARGTLSLSTLVRKDPESGARTAVKALYEYLAGTCQIAYETPQIEADDWSGVSYQKVRTPQDIFFFSGQNKGRGNCFDLSLFFAGCLESLGLNPLIIFTGELDASPTHAFVGCWTDRSRRFRPFLTDSAMLIEKIESGDLLVLEATGVAEGSTALSFEEARTTGREHLAKGPVHALDVSACRPPIGLVRPVMLANSPFVQRAFWAGQRLAQERKSKLYETLHILHGLCVADGELTRWLLERAGGNTDDVRHVIEQSLPMEQNPGVPIATKNYEICVSTARGNARSEGRSMVDEVDLLWAVVENPSRNVRRILEAAGCDFDTLVNELDQRWKRPGEMSIHRRVRRSPVK